jgi:hypothetical protein
VLNHLEQPQNGYWSANIFGVIVGGTSENRQNHAVVDATYLCYAIKPNTIISAF